MQPDIWRDFRMYHRVASVYKDLSDKNKLYMGLALMGSSLSFLILLAGIIKNEGASGFWLEQFSFYFKGILVLIGLGCLAQYKSIIHLERENYSAYRDWVLTSFVTALALVGIHGHHLMFTTGKFWFLFSDPSFSLPHITLALYQLHLMVGLVLTGSLVIPAIRNSSYVKGYIFHLNPKHAHRVTVLNIYWIGMAVLWIYLQIFFGHI